MDEDSPLVRSVSVSLAASMEDGTPISASGVDSSDQLADLHLLFDPEQQPTATPHLMETSPAPLALLARDKLPRNTTTNDHDTPTKTFHHFPFLPTEIRLKIWEFSTLLPRVIHITYDTCSLSSKTLYNRLEYEYQSYALWRIANKDEKTPLLDVCQESRFEAEKVIEEKWERMNMADDVNEYTFVNWDVDIIYLDTDAGLTGNESDVLGPEGLPFTYSTECRIKHLAIDMRLWRDWKFLINYGEDVSCDMCPRGSEDEARDLFRGDVAMLLIDDTVKDIQFVFAGEVPWGGESLRAWKENTRKEVEWELPSSCRDQLSCRVEVTNYWPYESFEMEDEDGDEDGSEDGEEDESELVG